MAPSGTADADLTQRNKTGGAVVVAFALLHIACVFLFSLPFHDLKLTPVLAYRFYNGTSGIVSLDTSLFSALSTFAFCRPTSRTSY
jgi:hypothetical protein